MTLRVAHVIAGLGARHGGPALAVVGSSRAVRSAGVETTIFTTDLAQPASAASQRRLAPGDLPADAESLDLRIFPARTPKRFAYAPELGRALARELGRYDIVHVHSLYLYPQLAAYRATRTQGTPVILAPCGALDPALRGRSRARKGIVDRVWQRAQLNEAAALHYKTQEEADLASDLGLEPPAWVVPNGIEWQEFQTLPVPGRFARNCPVVICLGRISHKKNIDVLIRALPRDAHLLVAGPDDEGLTPSLQALADELGVSVTFTGMLTGEDRLAALAAADVWALPSRTENFGTAVVEALAAGLPVVITPAVNIAPLLAAERAAVVCEQDRFASELRRLIDDAALRSALGDRARAVAYRYDWSQVAPRLVEMYTSVAARSGDSDRKAA